MDHKSDNLHLEVKKKKKRLVGISAVAQWLKNPTAVAQITVEA